MSIQKLTRREKMTITLKMALEFNAGVIAVCTAHYGNIVDERSFKRYKKAYEELLNEYSERVTELWEEE